MSLELTTRKQVSEHFGVTYDTVMNWEKKGLIHPFCNINGHPRYKLSDVVKAVTKKKGGSK